jgi:hypothetical protein
MRQQTFAENGFELYHKQTRREIFLVEMDAIIPWRELGEVIEPFYPRHEGAYWSRQRHEAHSFGRGHGGQRARQPGLAEPPARG